MLLIVKWKKNDKNELEEVEEIEREAEEYLQNKAETEIKSQTEEHLEREDDPSQAAARFEIFDTR